MNEPRKFDPVAARKFIEWLISLDDPDPESEGFQSRRTVTLNRIITEAREVMPVIPPHQFIEVEEYPGRCAAPSRRLRNSLCFFFKDHPDHAKE